MIIVCVKEAFKNKKYNIGLRYWLAKVFYYNAMTTWNGGSIYKYVEHWSGGVKSLDYLKILYKHETRYLYTKNRFEGIAPESELFMIIHDSFT